MPGAAVAEALGELVPGARCLFLGTSRLSEARCRRALARGLRRAAKPAPAPETNDHAADPLAWAAGHLTAAHSILAVTGVVEPFQNHKGFALRVQNISPPISSGLAPVSLPAPDGICRKNTHSQSASNIVE